MKELWLKIRDFIYDEEGASAVEYGILVAAIAAVIILVVYSIGGKAKTSFQKVQTALT